MADAHKAPGQNMLGKARMNAMAGSVTSRDFPEACLGKVAARHDAARASTLQLQRRLMDNELRLLELLADGGFSNGSYAFLKQQWITRWIPSLSGALWNQAFAIWLYLFGLAKLTAIPLSDQIL